MTGSTAYLYTCISEHVTGSTSSLCFRKHGTKEIAVKPEIWIFEIKILDKKLSTLMENLHIVALVLLNNIIGFKSNVVP